MPRRPPKMPRSSFVDYVSWGPFGGLDNIFCDRKLSCSTSPTSVNKFPPRVKNTAVGKTQVWQDLTSRELPGDTGIASIRARIPKLRPAEQYIKYQDTHADEI